MNAPSGAGLPRIHVIDVTLQARVPVAACSPAYPLR
jgi:hypothetical protein